MKEKVQSIIDAPSMMSRVMASTWPEAPGRVRCNRYYSLKDQDRVYAEGVTEWAVIDVNSGKLISDKYRLYSVSENIDTLGLSAGDLVITENAYAHTDDLYVYTDSESGAYNFGKVKSSTSDILGDYLYMTESSDGISLVNRDNSMGVVIATYATVGSILSVICDYYIFIAGAMLILAVAMIVCLVLVSKKNSDTEPAFKADEDKNEYGDTDNDDSDTDTETDEDDGEYYSDYDTDGIEEGLFSGI